MEVSALINIQRCAFQSKAEHGIVKLQELAILHRTGHMEVGKLILMAGFGLYASLTARAADKIRKSGKARFVGFSTHCGDIEERTTMLNNAAKGGWVDALIERINNEIGALLGDHLLEHTEGPDRLVASSVVSSSALDRVARHHGAHARRTLTGFKWIIRPVVDVWKALSNWRDRNASCSKRGTL